MPKIHPKLALIDAENGQKIGEPQISEKVAIFTQILKNSNLRQNDVIFIYIPRSFDTILAIISCLKLGVAFTFCRENGEKYERFRTTVVFDGREARRIHENSDEKTDKICYVITTSGTTGARKQVAVPVDCIQRNIDDFCSLFSLTPSDTILFSTSLLFDPSIVELFLAFQTGSTLILTPDAFRSEPHRMQSAIEKYRPTVAQFTPTVLEMLPSLPSILSDNTSLRILLIGGSHFPLQLVRTARSSNNPTRVFNVYGVTEISCWATVFEVETDCDEVLIGLPIGGSTLEIEQHGELVIGGPRQCYVNGKKAQKHYTGDRVERVGEEAIRIVGRVDRVVKHRGVRICLDHLTTIALRQNPHLHTIHVIHHLNRHLIQFTVGPCTSSEATTSFLTLRIDANTIVNVTVVHVPVMPINSSGKVDEKALLEILENLKSFQSGFREVLENKLNISLEDEQILDSTFVELGLKSLLAAEISTFFDENIQGDVIRTLLDATTSIREFLRNFDGESKITIEENRDPEAILVKVQRRRQPRMKWAIDLKKCIDGNVLVVNNTLAICASHAGIVVAVNPQTGECVWRTECGVRFEATPTLIGEQVVIGNKTSGLFFISLSTGAILSQIHLNDSSIGIRSRVAFDGNFIYCTAENGIFHVLDPVTRLSIFQCRIGRGGTSVGPIIAPDNSIFAITTSGAVARIIFSDQNAPKFDMTWRKEFGPLFAEPTFARFSDPQNDFCVIILNVHGNLRILNAINGDTTHQISLKSEQFFCAPLIIDNDNGNSKLMWIATKSGKLFQLSWSSCLSISRVFEFDQSFTFVKTPILSNQVITLQSVTGHIIFARLLNDNLEDVTSFSVSNKEVFTSPLFIDGKSGEKCLIIAGRDDFLRAFSYQ